MHDDLQMMRQLQFEKCLLDRQIPCRWVPDMGYGFGFPLFNFYPPLPYMFGQIFRFMGATFVETARYTFASAIILSGVAMYYLVKNIFGRAGGVLSSIFYVWAPYHAVDVYVRGAMNEAWALVFFPLILLFSMQLIREENITKRTKWTVLLAVSYAFLMLSHNLMLMIFTPVFAGWVVLFIAISKNWRIIFNLMISGIMALCFSAFFTLPAIVENGLTQIRGQLIGYYDYTAHFVSIKQLLFSNYWGYGPSVWGVNDDGMSFQVGYIYWILSIVVALLVLGRCVKLVRQKNLYQHLLNDKVALITGYFFVVGWITAFMTHSKSTPIWQLFPQLAYSQFPWRFLTIVIFSFSLVVGFIPYFLNEYKSTKRWFARLIISEKKYLVIITLVALVVIPNWNYFLPENGKMGPLTDEQKFSGAAWDLQQTAGIYDYLPATAEMAPREPMHQLVEFMKGEGSVAESVLGTDWARIRLNVTSDSAVIRLGIFMFPGWKVYVDEVESINYVDQDEKWGRMYVDLSPGVHNLRVEFTNTPIRSISNYVSALTWTTLIFYVVIKRKSGLASNKQ
ncbi:hypothetical protein IPM62_04750 [Candidatus Woesebacteria bacterium]|nr:MAG: hypothetical protein IPM62_04750 [Candidatus Woesebacteria bacterium]